MGQPRDIEIELTELYLTPNFEGSLQAGELVLLYV